MNAKAFPKQSNDVNQSQSKEFTDKILDDILDDDILDDDILEVYSSSEMKKDKKMNETSLIQVKIDGYFNKMKEEIQNEKQTAFQKPIHDSSNPKQIDCRQSNPLTATSPKRKFDEISHTDTPLQNNERKNQDMPNSHSMGIQPPLSLSMKSPAAQNQISVFVPPQPLPKGKKFLHNIRPFPQTIVQPEIQMQNTAQGTTPYPFIQPFTLNETKAHVTQRLKSNQPFILPKSSQKVQVSHLLYI